MSETYDTPQEAISSFKADLPALQSALAPLFSSSSTWEETRDKLSTLERAKMDILLAYTINNLVWVYLKLRGVDPEDHQVTKELERIKKYHAKIRQVEQPELQRTTQVDQEAAKRFVTAAIPRSQRRRGNEDMPSTSAAALARRQAGDSVGEGEGERAGRERAGKSERFRFFSGDGEKIGVGHGVAQGEQGGLSIVDGYEGEGKDGREEEGEEEDDEDGEEAVEEEGEVEVEAEDNDDEEDMDQDEEDMGDQADELLRGIQGEIDLARAQSQGEEHETIERTRTAASTHSKRKRAEDLV